MALWHCAVRLPLQQQDCEPVIRGSKGRAPVGSIDRLGRTKALFEVDDDSNSVGAIVLYIAMASPSNQSVHHSRRTARLESSIPSNHCVKYTGVLMGAGRYPSS